MKKAIAYLLIISMLLWIPSCGTLKEDSYTFSLDLKEVRKLCQTALESEEAFEQALADIDADIECTRDEFLDVLDSFKDHVVIFLPSSGRYVQYEINFELKGTKINDGDGASQKTSVNMVRQKYTRGADDCRAEGIFYSSSSPEPIYDETMQAMIQDGLLVDIHTRSDLYGWRGFRTLKETQHSYKCKEAYIYETSEYNLYYFYIYRDDETYVGSFEFKAYKEEDGKIPYFTWGDFYWFSFATIEELIIQQ